MTDKLMVVQIKGSNGSGKSTIVKDLMNFELDIDAGEEPKYLETSYGDVYGTLNEYAGWLGVGKYDPAKPTRVGCDPIPTIAQIKASIELTIRHALDLEYPFGVVFEGMMISTIKSTFYDYLLRMRDKYDIQPLFVILNAEPDGCIARIEGRGTKRKNFKPDQIVRKCALVLRHARTYPQDLVRYFSVEETAREDMLPAFLKLVGDEELYDVAIECGLSD
jgi:hypothetical protein